jgi:16S rRNA (cytosine967-C5)-methyltransferase
LALAAMMEDRDEIHAFDNDAGRLAHLRPRAARAGATCIVTHLRAGGAEPEIEAMAAQAARVVVDAPCCGSGAWRRRPEEKWRLTPGRLDALGAVQDALLDTAATMVRPGGRLVYMTCSVLPRENGVPVARFRARRPDFSLMPVASIWADRLLGAPPQPGREDLALSLLRTDTDGFYVAILQRSA